MGRFFRTAKPTFVENTMYTPPIELMTKGLAGNEMGYARASEPLPGLEIDHINTTEEKAYVQSITSEINRKIDDLTERTEKDPKNWRKYQAEKTKLQRELERRKKEGDIYRIEENKKLYNKLLEDNKDIDAETLNMFDNYLTNDQFRRTTQNLGDRFLDPELRKLQEAPDIDSFVGVAKKNLMPSGNETVRHDISSGRFIVTDKHGFRELTKDQVVGFAVNAALADPTVIDWMRQQHILLTANGRPSDFLNEDGSINRNNSFLQQIANAVVHEAAWQGTASGSIKADPYAKMAYRKSLEDEPEVEEPAVIIDQSRHPAGFEETIFKTKDVVSASKRANKRLRQAEKNLELAIRAYYPQEEIDRLQKEVDNLRAAANSVKPTDMEKSHFKNANDYALKQIDFNEKIQIQTLENGKVTGNTKSVSLKDYNNFLDENGFTPSKEAAREYLKEKHGYNGIKMYSPVETSSGMFIDAIQSDEKLAFDSATDILNERYNEKYNSGFKEYANKEAKIVGQTSSYIPQEQKTQSIISSAITQQDNMFDMTFEDTNEALNEEQRIQLIKAIKSSTIVRDGGKSKSSKEIADTKQFSVIPGGVDSPLVFEYNISRKSLGLDDEGDVTVQIAAQYDEATESYNSKLINTLFENIYQGMPDGEVKKRFKNPGVAAFKTSLNNAGSPDPVNMPNIKSMVKTINGEEITILWNQETNQVIGEDEYGNKVSASSPEEFFENMYK